MINLIIIYDVVNIFSMKNYESLRKLRVGVNRYTGVNWSTTTNFFDVIACSPKALQLILLLSALFFDVFEEQSGINCEASTTSMQSSCDN